MQCADCSVQVHSDSWTHMPWAVAHSAVCRCPIATSQEGSCAPRKRKLCPKDLQLCLDFVHLIDDCLFLQLLSPCYGLLQSWHQILTRMLDGFAACSRVLPSGLIPCLCRVVINLPAVCSHPCSGCSPLCDALVMFLEDFETFYRQSEALFIQDPLHTRYCLKYQHPVGKLVLKVTNDRVALQYKTDQQSELKKIEGLNNRFFALTSKGPDATETAATPVPEADPAPAPKKQKPARRTKG